MVRRSASDAETIELVGIIWSLSVPAVAFAFMLGLMRRRAIAGEMLGRLSVALSGPLDGRHLGATLRSALDDPSIDVLVPDGVPGRWRHTDGRAVARPDETGPVVTPIADGAARWPRSCTTRRCATTRSSWKRCARSCWPPSGTELVTTQLAASLSELAGSRERIARAADVERSRIERDLHDGAQQRLIGLRIRLALAEETTQTDARAGAEMIHDLGAEIDRTLEELRAIAHGVYPSLLGDRGLVDALRSLTAESPIPAHLITFGVDRQPAEIETAVYFTCLEAMQNAFKHARGATALWLALHQGRDLVFEVRDDGRGFMTPIGEHNGGLRNMRDRARGRRGPPDDRLRAGPRDARHRRGAAQSAGPHSS